MASGGASISSAITLPGVDSVYSWNLDSLGNWHKTTRTPVGGAETTEVRQHNKLHQITEFGAIECLYDTNGNMTDDGSREFTYDAFNRVKEVSLKLVGSPSPSPSASPSPSPGALAGKNKVYVR
ncbi:MAG: hypothetical protein GWP14_03825 [Actinobacteria bacterium]|nr:hypothetical protein [Actinomycetota bacterium]